MPRLTAILIALSVCVTPLSSARADDKADAITAMTEGDRLLAKGKYDRALAKYREAYEIYNTPKIYYPIAIALTKMERYLDAMDTYKQFLLEATDAKESLRQKAEDQVEALKQEIGTLTFAVKPEGASITVDDVDRGESPLGESVFVNPGSHKYTVSKTGYISVSDTIDADAGEERPIEVSLEPSSGGKPPERRLPGTTQRMHRRVLVGGIIFSTALALSASMTGVLALSKHSTFKDTTQTMSKREAARRSGKKFALTTDLLMLTTAAAAGFTTYWYITKIRPMSEPRPVGVITPYAGPDGGGVVFVGTF